MTGFVWSCDGKLASNHWELRFAVWPDRSFNHKLPLLRRSHAEFICGEFVFFLHKRGSSYNIVL